MSIPTWFTTQADAAILQGLARRYAEIAARPEMEERRKLWYAHNDLQVSRPLVLVESLTPGLKKEIFGLDALRCGEEWARGVEEWLRGQIYHFTTIGDDDVPPPYYPINWFLEQGNYGVEVKIERALDSTGTPLGFHWEPPIQDIVADFGKLQPRTFSVDREQTLAWQKHLESVFGEILPVKIRGAFWWTMGLTWRAIDLVGLENLMFYMYDQPEMLHRLMAFLRDDHLCLIDLCEREGLLSLNNEMDYTGSGSRGFTHALPARDYVEGRPVRPRDMWVLSESQETVGVSPKMFAEFVLPYQKTITERFGLVYYGCCEPVNNRIGHILSIPNLRSVSVSPWADEQIMAEALGRRYVYSRKPSPALLSTAAFDEECVRQDIRNTLAVARGCNVELVMKDLHTTSGHPERMVRWVQICREEIRRAGWQS